MGENAPVATALGTDLSHAQFSTNRLALQEFDFAFFVDYSVVILI